MSGLVLWESAFTCHASVCESDWIPAKEKLAAAAFHLQRYVTNPQKREY